MKHMFDEGLEQREANYVPLTPIDFIVRAAEVYGDRPAVVHGDVRRTWRETYERARRLASALRQAGIERGDTVAALLPNIPPMVEAHFGVPMAGAVLNTLNTRLDPESLAVHAASRRGQGADRRYASIRRDAAALRALELPAAAVIDVDDALPADGQVARRDRLRSLPASGDPASPGRCPPTSGTRSR